ncbi:hypothetical protein WICPIJ_002399 [Wickerhamomyces pijperi]|uniref:Uncharacterized protein n=1 Tax=Wickerhamomyces pijperi TaxID=599730 RepID=A0A9P8TPU5_WICPI|nr:hypothetical protein WICPIJ_002399 [Wickerhamomyces pijperi]
MTFAPFVAVVADPRLFEWFTVKEIPVELGLLETVETVPEAEPTEEKTPVLAVLAVAGSELGMIRCLINFIDIILQVRFCIRSLYGKEAFAFEYIFHRASEDEEEESISFQSVFDI